MTSVFYYVELLWGIMKQVYCKDITLISAISRGELGELNLVTFSMEESFYQLHWNLLSLTLISPASQHRTAQHTAQGL